MLSQVHGRLAANQSKMVRGATLGVLIALLLSVLGLLAYTSFPKVACSPTTQYIHAALKGSTRAAAADAVGTAVAKTAAAPAQVLLQGMTAVPANGTAAFLAGLLQPQQANPDILDAAVAAGVTSKQLSQLLQLQQTSFCLAGHHKTPVPGSTGVPFNNVTIFVYGSGDIVSDSLKGSGHGWESAEIQEWLWAIRQWKPQPAPAAGSSTRPLAVDIGANLAWFSLNAAAAGARVAAFEAMPANIALIRRSLCASPWLSDHIALYGTGLGESVTSCYMISGTGNRGDGFVQCDAQKAHNTPGYEVRGIIPIRLLDSLLQEEVQVLKIDVEGFEQKVLTGAKQLLSQHKVHYIMAECNTGIIGEEGGKQFIQFLHQQGYDISPLSFKGPFWEAQQIPTATCTNINLYARRRAA